MCSWGNNTKMVSNSAYYVLCNEYWSATAYPKDLLYTVYKVDNTAWERGEKSEVGSAASSKTNIGSGSSRGADMAPKCGRGHCRNLWRKYGSQHNCKKGNIVCRVSRN